ncbi:unnamed protein product [Rotaria magnacalcarata]|uniref:Uncharacterized protein n=4 Tax=Rotaria magnacalcarata TaxID=392030 RepID=A0A816PQM5_9BILA|nr:unnamed protein product [Rotaria magnacalcarata]CAF2142634.1 unnamed protein product [Rotaria magnacalcarata]CAF3877139.1 unnamed protein product [Rotaria magnacalcarata]CAF4031636.1 unnamed protein product [Rotaria magnacalcarata]
MATPGRTYEIITSTVKSADNAFVLIWLDDSAEDDPTIKGVLSSLFDSVITFTDPAVCLESVESDEIGTTNLYILISGKYGQMFVRERLQPLNRVQYIYVFCYDTVRHSQWAETCDKVRCVFSDINKILQCMQNDIQSSIEQQQESGEHDEVQLPPQEQQPEAQVQQQKQQQQQQGDIQQQRERFTDDNNLFDQLALNLVINSPDDGVEDFTDYCQVHNENNNPDQHQDPAADVEVPVELQEQYYIPEKAIEDWYQPNLPFTNINSNDLIKLWKLRWFIRSFHRQLTSEHEKFVQNKTKFTVNYGTWLSVDELDAMKHRISEIIIITELLLTHTNRQAALDSIENEEKNKHKVILEINIDPHNRTTVPFAEIKKEQVLLWFGARYQIIKVEYVEQQDEQQQQHPYWLIGLNLNARFNSTPSIQNLYQYYFKELTELNNVHQAFGRILIHKGYYVQAEKWLQTDNHYEELAELAIRQGHLEQAKEYLEHLSEDSHEANLLYAYYYVLTSKDNFPKARLIFMKIVSEATDRYIRAQANIGLGFISLIMTQQIDLAFEYFTIANEVLRRILPDIHPSIAKSYIGLGYTYYHQHKIADAKKSFQTAFNIQKQSLIYNHPEFAKTRNGFAYCFSNDKQTIKKASNEFEHSLNILLHTFRHDFQQHPQILAARSDIEKLKKGKELRSRNTLLDYI